LPNYFIGWQQTVEVLDQTLETAGISIIDHLFLEGFDPAVASMADDPSSGSALSSGKDRVSGPSPWFLEKIPGLFGKSSGTERAKFVPKIQISGIYF
jgi:hypothetical protein